MTDVRYEFDRVPPELDRLAVCEWLQRHGVDPREVAVPGWIELRPERRQVAWAAYLWEEAADGEPRRILRSAADAGIRRESVLQLEARPMPFPLSSQE